MSRAANAAFALLVAVSALVGIGWHYSSTGLAFAHACRLSYNDDQSAALKHWLFWVDRVWVRSRHSSRKPSLVRALIKRGNEVNDCASWPDSIPYLEDAVAESESLDNSEARVRLEAIEWLGIHLVFSSSKPSEHVISLWRQAVKIREQHFPRERDDLLRAKFVFSHALAQGCFSNFRPDILNEATRVVEELIRYDPAQLDAWELRGDIFAHERKWPNAERFYRESHVRRVQIQEVGPVEGFPRRSFTADKLAIVLGVQGKRAEADKFQKLASDARAGTEIRTWSPCNSVPLGPEDISPTSRLWPF